MNGTVSEDAVRPAMYRIPETAGLDCSSSQIIDTIAPALGLPWILDIDVTAQPVKACRREPKLVIIPKSRGVPAICITVIWWPTSRSALAWKCVAATNTPEPKACPACGKPPENSPATNGLPSSVGIDPAAAQQGQAGQRTEQGGAGFRDGTHRGVGAHADTTAIRQVNIPREGLGGLRIESWHSPHVEASCAQSKGLPDS